MLIEIKLKRRGNVRPLLNVSLYQQVVFHPAVQNEGKMWDMNSAIRLLLGNSGGSQHLGY
jgi:hypothetical protein